MMHRIIVIIAVLFGVGLAGQAQPEPEGRPDIRHIILDEPMTPHDFAMTHNICMEQVHYQSYHWYSFEVPADTDLYFLDDMQPCYNESGQRLVFYDADGKRLETPIYSEMHVYITQPGQTLDDITRTLNVCFEDINARANLHFQHLTPLYRSASYTMIQQWQLPPGQELFIPDVPPCYDDAGRLLKYTPDDVLPLNGDVVITKNIRQLTIQRNICLDVLLEYNHIIADSESDTFRTLAIPQEAPPCYERFRYLDKTRFELANELGICANAIHVQPVVEPGYDFYVPIDAPSCELPIAESLAPGEQAIAVEPGENYVDIALRYNICVEDLFAANNVQYNWQSRNVQYNMVILPDAPACYDLDRHRLIYSEDGEPPQRSEYPVHLTNQDTSLQKIAWEHGVCLLDLLAVNPHLSLDDGLYWRSRSGLRHKSRQAQLYVDYRQEVYIPPAQTSCYQSVSLSEDRPRGDVVRQIAETHNICLEVVENLEYERHTFLIPDDMPPCYDENGHRLSYLDIETGEWLIEPVRVPLPVHTVRAYHSTYELSRRLNVCVSDLLAYNPILRESLPWSDLHVFIPETDLCYDESGAPLLYDNPDALPFAPPESENILIHKISPRDTGEHTGQIEHIAQMYNVCSNRLKEYNPDLVQWVDFVSVEEYPDRVVMPEGILVPDEYLRIPTHRPDCYEYDEYIRFIRYACYDEPLDMSQLNPDATLNPDASHCYDIEDLQTTIWHQENRYVFQEREMPLHHVDYLAWCYGVSHEDILLPGADTIVPIGAYETLIRNPTRDCYLRGNDGTQTMHFVQPGENLHTIARQYGTFAVWIAAANDLQQPDLLWRGQGLVIPGEGSQSYLLYAIIGGLFLVIAGVYLLYRRWKHRRPQSKKKRHS